jgi:hypothetical protein
MLPIESMGDAMLVLEMIDCPVRIVLHCGCEYYYLVMWRQGFQKVICPRPDVKNSFLRLKRLWRFFHVVQECLI